mgnify:CR=1 FL=1
MHQLVVRRHLARDRRRAAGEGARHQGLDPVSRDPGLRADPRHHRARRPDGRDPVRRRPGAARTPAGQCIGQWKRDEIKPGTRNTIVTSYNRNFPRGTTAASETLAFMGSPEIVAAFALAGRLSFNPLKDTLQGGDGKPFTLTAPKPAPDLPARTVSCATSTAISPRRPTARRSSSRSPPTASACSCSTPFAAVGRQGLRRAPAASQGEGNVHDRSHLPAGPVAAASAATSTTSRTTCSQARSAPSAARPTRRSRRSPASYKAKGLRWIVVGDENYGEGSSREHAAMSPRFLGCAGGHRPLVRPHPRVEPQEAGDPAADVREPGRLRQGGQKATASASWARDARPGSRVDRGAPPRRTASEDRVALRHTLNAEQIGWFKAGSALNVIKSQIK